MEQVDIIFSNEINILIYIKSALTIEYFTDIYIIAILFLLSCPTTFFNTHTKQKIPVTFTYLNTVLARK